MRSSGPPVEDFAISPNIPSVTLCMVRHSSFFLRAERTTHIRKIIFMTITIKMHEHSVRGRTEERSFALRLLTAPLRVIRVQFHNYIWPNILKARARNVPVELSAESIGPRTKIFMFICVEYACSLCVTREQSRKDDIIKNPIAHLFCVYNMALLTKRRAPVSHHATTRVSIEEFDAKMRERDDQNANNPLLICCDGDGDNERYKLAVCIWALTWATASGKRAQKERIPEKTVCI